MLAILQDNQKSITISSIKCLNFKFFFFFFFGILKLYTKQEFTARIVNNIQLKRNLASMLRIMKTSTHIHKELHLDKT